MQLSLHPRRREALTASETTFTRWSLATHPATLLAQVSTALATIFRSVYDDGGRTQIDGGISPTPDGECFALQQPWLPHRFPKGPCVIEWRRFDNLLPTRTVTIPHAVCPITSLESSPDGRWLVIENNGHLFLLNWQTGELISRHFSNGYATSGLTALV